MENQHNKLYVKFWPNYHINVWLDSCISRLRGRPNLCGYYFTVIGHRPMATKQLTHWCVTYHTIHSRTVVHALAVTDIPMDVVYPLNCELNILQHSHVAHTMHHLYWNELFWNWVKLIWLGRVIHSARQNNSNCWPKNVIFTVNMWLSKVFVQSFWLKCSN